MLKNSALLALSLALIPLPSAFASKPGRPQISPENLKRHVSYLASPELQGRKPGTNGHQAAVDYIESQLESFGLSTWIEEKTPWMFWKSKIKNIVAEYPSRSHPEKCIILAAHYDHYGDLFHDELLGANDNATGVATLLEVARVLGKNPVDLGATVHIVFPDQEEAFISGSKRIASWLGLTCKQVVLTMTLDMVGKGFFKGLDNHLFVFGSESGQGLPALVAEAKKLQGSLFSILDAPISVLEVFGVARSDYDSFRREQMPFLFLTTGMPATYHTAADTVDSIDWGLHAKASKFVLDTLRSYPSLSKTATFGFIEKKNQKPDYRLASQKISVLMDAMMQFPVENKLRVRDIRWMKKKQAAWAASQNPPHLWELQRAVIRIITIVGRNSTDKASYFKSIIGKLL